MGDMSSAPAAVSLYDGRPFFEKALKHGIARGILDAQKLEAIRTDAPKGMVQIARYFGSEYLRPELETAKDRIVNLVSLCLEHASDGDLDRAAEALRDHSFLSRSKGGSDMLKALIGMPQTSHFGMNERRGFRDEHIPLLAKWSLRSLPDYRLELTKRETVANQIAAALWLAERLDLDEDELAEAGPDGEAVIRSALLVLAGGGAALPDWHGFEKLVAALRKKNAAGKAPKIAVPAGLPAELRPAVETVLASLLADLPKVLDAAIPARQLFQRTPAFIGRYFWIEDGLAEVDRHDRETSAAWQKATGGSDDESALLTLFLCLAAGATPKTLLTERTATTLIRKIQKSGMKPELAESWIREHAPAQYVDDYAELWHGFVEESRQTLESDAAYALNDSLALLRRELQVK